MPPPADAAGQDVSRSAYVDLDRADLFRVRTVAEAPILSLGETGTFDEHGIFPMNVVAHDRRILAYTTGWSRRVSVSVETGIGLAVSLDGGETFARYGTGPVLSATLHELFLICDAFIRVIGGVFHMWYIFGTPWTRPEAVTEAERLHGHRRTYALDTLERDAVAAGLRVVHRSGIFFKALANFQ